MEKLFGYLVIALGSLLAGISMSSMYGVLNGLNSPRGSSIIVGLTLATAGLLFNRVLATRTDSDQRRAITRFQELLGALTVGMAANTAYFLVAQPYSIGWLNHNNALFSAAIAAGALVWATLMAMKEHRLHTQCVAVTIHSSRWTGQP